MSINLVVKLIDTLDSRTREKKSQSNLKGVWRGDSMLEMYINDLKAKAKGLSTSCTKYTMLSFSSQSEIILESISNEVLDNIQALVPIYLQITDCAIGKPFLKVVFTSVREEIVCTMNLLTLLQNKKEDEIKSATGLVWAANEAIQNLPTTNRTAYRRLCMEYIGVLKDTIREFQEALDGAKDISAPVKVDVNEDDEREFDEEEDELYSVVDIGTLGACLSLMSVVYDSCRQGLDIMTKVADIADSLVDDSELATSDACRVWVALVVDATEKLQNFVIDLGSELYPPIDFEQTRHFFVLLHEETSAYIQLLKSGSTELRSMRDGGKVVCVGQAELASIGTPNVPLASSWPTMDSLDSIMEKLSECRDFL